MHAMYGKQWLIRAVKTLLIIEFSLQVITFARFAWGAFAQKQVEKDIVTRTWALRDPTFRAVFNEESRVWENYEPFVGWKTRELHTEHINVSSDGIRRTVGSPGETISGVPTIYFFGGSTMWGEGHADDTTIPSLVAKQMNKTSPQANIVNYGEIGYGSTQEVLRLALLLKSGLHPDHVILYDGCNDFFLSTLDAKPHLTFRDEGMKTKLGNIWALPDDSETRLNVPNTTVFSNTFWQSVFRGAATYIQIIHYPVTLYDSLVHKTTATSQTVVRIQDPEKYTDTIVENYLENIKILDALAQAYHFDYRLIWQPTVYSKELTPEERNLPDIKQTEYTKLSGIYSASAQKLSQALGDKFIDMSAVYPGVKDSIFTDTCHVTVQGNTLVSQEIVRTMGDAWGLK